MLASINSYFVRNKSSFARKFNYMSEIPANNKSIKIFDRIIIIAIIDIINLYVCWIFVPVNLPANSSKVYLNVPNGLFFVYLFNQSALVWACDVVNFHIVTRMTRIYLDDSTMICWDLIISKHAVSCALMFRRILYVTSRHILFSNTKKTLNNLWHV